MRVITLIFVTLMGLIVASFAIINASAVKLNYLIGSVTLPLSFLLMMVFIFGILVGVFLMLIRLIHVKIQKRQLAGQVKSLQIRLDKANAAAFAASERINNSNRHQPETV